MIGRTGSAKWKRRRFFVKPEIAAINGFFLLLMTCFLYAGNYLPSSRYAGIQLPAIESPDICGLFSGPSLTMFLSKDNRVYLSALTYLQNPEEETGLSAENPRLSALLHSILQNEPKTRIVLYADRNTAFSTVKNVFDVLAENHRTRCVLMVHVKRPALL